MNTAAMMRANTGPDQLTLDACNHGQNPGAKKSSMMMTTHTHAIVPMVLLHLPKFHGPGRKSFERKRKKIGMAYETYSPTVPIETTAKNATDEPSVVYSDGTPKRKAATADSQTAFTGARVLGCRRCHSRCPGTAPSRENA